MSSACMCHVEGAFCFYCEVYSPVVAENERLYGIIADMQATMMPIDHCDSCAHLSVELAQHKAVRESYLAENERLKSLMDDCRQTLTLEGSLYEALREIDTHIRATSDPIPHIVATLKRVLPEYTEENGDPFADEEVVESEGE